MCSTFKTNEKENFYMKSRKRMGKAKQTRRKLKNHSFSSPPKYPVAVILSNLIDLLS